MIAPMVSCPQCGTQNSPTQPACTCCGAAIAPNEARAGVKVPWKQTLLGLSPKVVPSPDHPAVHRTMLGVAPDPNRPEDVPDGSTPGISEAGLARGAELKKTMLGIAPPAPIIAEPANPVPEAGTSPDEQSPAEPAEPGFGSNEAAWPSLHRTMLGVARPGIAPLAPGVQKPLIAEEQPELPFPQTPPIRAPEPASEVDQTGRRRFGPWVRIGALGGLFLFGVLALAVWLAFGRSRLEASIRVDDRGAERLDLVCPTCADGTKVSLGVREAVFRTHRATLELEQPLEVGRNRLALGLRAPTGRTDTIELVVPVDYRVQGDLTGLAEEVPKLRVLVEATPETTVVVNGQPVLPAPGGKGSASVNVASALTGMAASTERLERKMPFVVRSRRDEPHAGEIALGIPIVPLVVEAPNERVITDARDFMLAGRTAPGAGISVAGRPIAVDATGRFAQLMNVSSVGTATIVVRATLAEHAPRMVPIEVRRVESLRQEAQRIQSGATRSYAALLSGLDSKRGWLVELEGDVVEARITAHTTVLLVDAVRDCAERPCLARLVFAAPFPAEKAQRLTAYGRLSGVVEGPRAGSRIPEVRVDFVLRGPAP
jgi:hypothetical protein